MVHAEGLNVMLFDMRRGNRASVCASERKRDKGRNGETPLILPNSADKKSVHYL